MRATGSTTSRVDRALNGGLMGATMKGSFTKGGNMVREYTSGPMAATTQVHGKITNCRGMESTSGPQGGATLGNGSTARCTVKANTFGRTDANTKGGTSTTKNMGPGSTVGPMDGSLTASGSMEDERGRVN